MSPRQPTPDADLDQRINAWLDDGPERAPDSLLESTLAPIPAMAQRRRSLVAVGRLTVRVGALARLAAAAVLVIALVGVAGLVARTAPSGGVGATPVPSATPIESEPLPSGVAFTNAGPLGAGTGRETGKAGTYQTLLFKPVVRFTVPAGWAATNLVNTFVGGGETAAGIPIGNGDGVIVVTAPATVDPPAPGDPGTPLPPDVLAWLVANRQLTLSSGPTPVTIGGIGGQEIEGSVAATARLDPVDGFYRPVDFLVLLPRHHFRIAVLRIGGQQVLVATIANADLFEGFRSVADGVIGSFVFPATPGSSQTP